MKNEFNKNDAQVLATAIDSALPSLMLRNTFTEDEEDYLFSLELNLLDCSGFTIQFNCEENNE